MVDKSEDIINVFITSLINGNRKKCSDIVHNLLNENISIIDLYENLIKPSLYKIGELWEYNKISVAVEHMATSTTEAILNELYAQVISDIRQSKKVVVGCVENEFHQVGIKMVSDIFEQNGWDTFFLGANTPLKDLILFAKSINPDIIALSLSIYFNIPMLQKMILEIKETFPGVQILVGGQAFSRGGSNIIDQYQNVVLIKDLRNLESYIQKTLKNG